MKLLGHLRAAGIAVLDRLEKPDPFIFVLLALIATGLLSVALIEAVPLSEFSDLSQESALKRLIEQALLRWGVAATILALIGAAMRATAHNQGPARSWMDQGGKLLAVVAAALGLYGTLFTVFPDTLPQIIGTTMNVVGGFFVLYLSAWWLNQRAKQDEPLLME